MGPATLRPPGPYLRSSTREVLGRAFPPARDFVSGLLESNSNRDRYKTRTRTSGKHVVVTGLGKDLDATSIAEAV